MHHLTTFVGTLAAARPSNARLHGVILDARKLHVMLTEACDLIPPWDTSLPFPGMQIEHCLFVEYFLNLMRVLQPELSVLGAKLSNPADSSIGTAQEELFWELWRVLVASCHAYCTVTYRYPRLWPHGLQAVGQLLLNCLQSLLHWLLTFTRSPAWRMMTAVNGRKQRDRQLLMILTPPIILYLSLTSLPPPSFIGVLPPDLLSFLLCLFSEQFTDVPSLVPRWRGPAGTRATNYTQATSTQCLPSSSFLPDATASSLVMIIHKLAPHCSYCPFIATPAVLHAVKAILIKPRAQSPTAPESVQMHAPAFMFDCLNRLLLHVHARPSSCKLSVMDMKTNVDTVGLPLHANPVFSTQAMETDIRLFQAMGDHMEYDPSATQVCYSVQTLVVQGWILATSNCSLPPAVRYCMTSSIIGLVKQCTKRGQQFLGQQLREGRGRQEDCLITAEVRVRQRPGGLHATGTTMHQRNETVDLDCARAVRVLLQVISSSQFTGEQLRCGSHSGGGPAS